MWGTALNLDPTAGTTLVRVVVCPRCGIEKGRVKMVRPGLCGDCRSVVTSMAERRAWAA